MTPERELGVLGDAHSLATAPELALDAGDSLAGGRRSPEVAEMVYELATVRLLRSNPPRQSRT